MCTFCHRSCGDREFCSPECYNEYQEAQREAAPVDDLPGESRYWDAEPEWDVVGGL